MGEEPAGRASSTSRWPATRRPTVAVTVFAIAMAAGADAPAATTALVGAAVLAGQLSVGWSNDWIDADRDAAVGRTDKPVGAGRLAVATVRTAALSAAAACVVLSLALGWRAGLVHLATVASAWAYNVRLKSTVWSWAPYAFSFGFLPAGHRAGPARLAGRRLVGDGGGRPARRSARTGRTWCRTCRTTGPPASAGCRTGWAGRRRASARPWRSSPRRSWSSWRRPVRRGRPPRRRSSLAVGLTIVGTVLALGGGRHRLPFLFAIAVAAVDVVLLVAVRLGGRLTA